MHGQLGDETGVFDNRNKVVLMQFEPQDAPGVYTVKAVLHDNNARLDVPVEATVELLKKPDIEAAQPAATPPANPPAIVSPPPEPPVAAPPVHKAKRHHRRRRH